MRGVVIVPANRKQLHCWTPISENNSDYLDDLKGVDVNERGDKWAPVFEFVYGDDEKEKLEFHVTDPSGYIEPNQKAHRYLAYLGVRLAEEDTICTDVVVTGADGKLLEYDAGQIVMNRINMLI